MRTVIARLKKVKASSEKMKHTAAVTAPKRGRTVQTSVSAVTRIVVDYAPLEHDR
jgi:hypothetical protein